MLWFRFTTIFSPHHVHILSLAIFLLIIVLAHLVLYYTYKNNVCSLKAKLFKACHYTKICFFSSFSFSNVFKKSFVKFHSFVTHGSLGRRGSHSSTVIYSLKWKWFSTGNLLCFSFLFSCKYELFLAIPSFHSHLHSHSTSMFG